MQGERAIVVIGGGPLSRLAIDRAIGADESQSFVIAADSGLDHAVAAGILPDVLVGDLDSISAAGRMWAYEHAAEIEEHPPDKDASDTELAIARALRVPNLRRLCVLGGSEAAGELRLDHLLSTILALGHPTLAALTSVCAVLGHNELRILHPGRKVTLDLHAGQTFSLLALHGSCAGICVQGARWPLHDATLTATETRGLSNQASPTAHDQVEVSVGSGVLTVVIP
ncbi:MAG: thiamine diphosphokinase [Actinobacteria bacterium]|nr:thiamine diphosphokinase [Actinomycetota bacterium]